MKGEPMNEVDIKDWLEKLDKKLDIQSGKLTKLDVSINGNGTPGINQRLKIVEKAVLILVIAFIVFMARNPECLAIINKIF
jgi:hypothetical protein